jgi:hypothetical protein
MITVDISFDPIIAQLGPFQLGWHGVFTFGSRSDPLGRR